MGNVLFESSCCQFETHRYWMNGEFVYNPFGYNIDHSMTHFRLMFRFHTPRKHQKTRSFTDVFRVYRNGRLVWKLQHIWITNSVNKGRDHSLITYEKIFRKISISYALTHRHSVRNWGKICWFPRNILRTFSNG